MPATRRVTDGAGVKPPVRMMPDSGGKLPALCALNSATQGVVAVACGDHERALFEPIQQVLGGHRANEDGAGFSTEQLRVSRHELGSRSGE